MPFGVGLFRGGSGDDDSTRVTIDTRKIFDLGKAFAAIGRSARSDTLARPLNEAGDRLSPKIKDKLQKWTGLRRTGVVLHSMSKHRASGGHLSYAIKVQSGWFAVTQVNFGASWSQSSAGVSHGAWQGGNTERGTFIRGGVAYRRPSSDRYPLKVIYGSNVARELERHASEVRVMQHQTLKAHYIPRVYHHIGRSVSQAKATYGL